MGKLFRIWKNRETGFLAESREDHTYEPLDLVYDRETKVVYYKFTEQVIVNNTNLCDEEETRVGYLTPYISENGKICRFINNQIVEIL